MRYKSTKPQKNEYIIQTPKEKKVFKENIGAKVPDIVTKIVNMSNLNIQDQLDPHFLISESGPQISRTINTITNAEDANQWIKDLTKQSAAIKMQLKMVREDYAKTSREVQKYKGIERAGKLITKLYRAEKTRLRLEEEYSNIENILADIEDTEAEIKRFRGYFSAEDVVDDMGKTLHKIELLLEEKEAINDMLNEKEKLEQSRKNLIKTQKEYIKVLVDAGLCPFCFGKIKNTRSIENGIKKLYTA
jgi:hypothetical protein